LDGGSGQGEAPLGRLDVKQTDDGQLLPASGLRAWASEIDAVREGFDSCRATDALAFHHADRIDGSSAE
jgi:hypothetical protein